MASAAYISWLKGQNREDAVVLAHLNYMTEVASLPVAAVYYLSDRPYIDNATPRQYIDAIVNVPMYKRDLTGDAFGSYSASFGTLELANEDGALDGLVAAFTAGHTISFYYGGIGWALSAFELIFSAKIVKVVATSFGRLSVQLADTGLLIDKSIGGDIKVGGLGPNADRFRPLGFGFVRQVECMVLVEAYLRYVCTDTGMGTTGMTYTIVTVRDKGVSVLYTDNGDGTFDLTYSPTGGAITADVLYYASGPEHICVSDFMVHMIGDRAGLINAGHYTGAGATFDVRPGSGIPAWLDAGGEDYAIGLLNFEKRNVIDLLTEVGNTGLNFWGITRTGGFTFGRIRPNDIASLGVASQASIAEADFKAGTFKIEHADPAYYRLSCVANRNWSQQSEFAGVLTPNQRGTLSRKGLAVIQNPTSGTQYNANPQNYNLSLAVSPQLETLLSADNDVTGDLRARHWMDTARAKQAPWIETVHGTFNIEYYALELGDPVTLQMLRYGYDAGELVQVIGIDINLTDAEVALRLCRRSTSSISADPGDPLPPEEPVPLPIKGRGRSALRFETGGAPPVPLLVEMHFFVFDPVSLDALYPTICPIPGLTGFDPAETGMQAAWQELLDHGDPASCVALCMEIQIYGANGDQFDITPIQWYDDSDVLQAISAFYHDFDALSAGASMDGATLLQDDIDDIEFTDTAYFLIKAAANTWPEIAADIHGTHTPNFFANAAIVTPLQTNARFTINGGVGSALVRLVAFLKDGDYTGYANMYERLFNVDVGTSSTRPAAGVATSEVITPSNPEFGNTSVGEPHPWPTQWAWDAFPIKALPVANLVSASVPIVFPGDGTGGGTLYFRWADSLGYFYDVFNPDSATFIVSPYDAGVESDFTVTVGDFTAGEIKVEWTGANAPYPSGTQIEIQPWMAGNTWASYFDARALLPKPVDIIQLTFL